MQALRTRWKAKTTQPKEGSARRLPSAYSIFAAMYALCIAFFHRAERLLLTRRFSFFSLSLRASSLRLFFLAVTIITAFSAEHRAFAQSLSLFNISTANFPRMRANVVAFDAQGNLINDQSNLRLTEDGVERAITSYSCGAQSPRPISAVLTIDISGSMGWTSPGSNESRLTIAKNAANAFIDAMANDGSECGIVGFETNSYPFQSFTTDKTLLKQVVNSLTPLFGTNYQAAFLNPVGGAIPMMSRANNSNRAIVFLTDGMSSSSARQVIDGARAVGASVYVITIGFNTPLVLEEIARETGGESFSDVKTSDEAVAIYRQLANRVGLSTPCAIEWTTELLCVAKNRVVELSAPTALPKVTARSSYLPPVDLINRLRIFPISAQMGSVAVGEQATQTMRIDLQAGSQNLVVTAVRSSDPAFRVREQNFTLVAGAPPRQLTIDYQAADSSYHFATFTAETESGCAFEFYATAGFPGIRPTIPSLKLTHPVGGEVFVVGSDTAITWKGVPPSEDVELDYSINGGKSWIRVDDGAAGLRRAWNVPNTPSDSCLMRVRQKNPSAAAFFGDSVVVLRSVPQYRHNGNVMAAEFNPQGSFIVSGGNDRKINIWYGDNANLGEIYNHTPTLDRVSSVAFTSAGGILASLFMQTSNALLAPPPIPPLNENVAFQATTVWGGSAAGSIHGSLTTPRRFVATSLAQSAAIHVYESGLGSYRTLPSSDGARTLSARYTPPFVITNLSESTTYHGILAAMQTGVEQIRFWYFVNGDERNMAPQPLRWTVPGGAQPVYAEAAADPNATGNIRIAVACSDKRVRFLWLANTGGLLSLQPHPLIEEIAIPEEVTMASFSRDGNFLAVVGGNKVFIFSLGLRSELQTVLNTQPLVVHKLRINSARWSPDGSRIVTAADGADSNLAVWFVKEKLPLQEDISPQLWRIVRPEIRVVDINMGRVQVGTVKDSLVAGAALNLDPYPASVRRVRVQGGGSAFAIVSGEDVTPFTIPPNQSRGIEFRFAPLQEGEFTDVILYETQHGEIIQARIQGIGVRQTLQLSATEIDWGEHFVGVPADTVRAVIRNLGNEPVTLTQPSVAGPNGGVIRTFEPRGVGSGAFGEPNPNSTAPLPQTFTLGAGDSLLLAARFTPPAVGRFGAPLIVPVADNSLAPLVVPLYGTGIQAGPRLSPPADGVQTSLNECEPVTMEVPLANSGTETLRIDSVFVVGLSGAPSAEFQVLSYPTSIEPNDVEHNVVRIRFTPQSVGTVGATLVVRSNSFTGEARIPLQGRLERPILEISQRFIVFPPVEPGETASTTITVRNVGNAPAPWFTVPNTFNDQSETPRMRITPTVLNMAALSSGATAQLQLTFLGGAAGLTYTDIVGFLEGCFSDSVSWSATVKSAPRLETLSALQTITCESTATLRLPITNNGTATARPLVEIEPPLANVRIIESPAELSTGATATAIIEISPLARAGALLFSVRVSESTTGTLPLVQSSVVKHDAGILIEPDVLAFPPIEAGGTTQATVRLRNNGSATVALPPGAISGANARFRWNAPPSLPPYSETEVVITFSETADGVEASDSFIIPVDIDGVENCASVARLSVSGSTLPPSSAHLSFTDDAKSPGDTAEFRVFLRDRARVPLGATITDTLRYNVTLLSPLAPLPFGEIRAGERFVPLRLEVRSDNPDEPLAVLRFRVALGNDTLTRLSLLGTPTTRAEKMTVTAEEATFRLTGLARAGGTRLIFASAGTMSIIETRPNPATNELTLEFYSLAAEEYTVTLWTALGMRTTFNDERFFANAGVNSRVLDLSRLPAGAYTLHLRNKRETQARRVLIVR
jgi:WD40 repeat protein